MTWTVECQPTTPGLKWARKLIYGADSFAATTVNDVKTEIIKSPSVTGEIENSVSVVEADRRTSNTHLLDSAAELLRERSSVLGVRIRQVELREADYRVEVDERVFGLAERIGVTPGVDEASQR